MIQTPKLFTYSVIWTKTDLSVETTLLTTDPKGWDEQSVAFPRGEDFGINAEFTVPFYFSREGRTKLKEIYDTNSQFATAHVKIEKRMNDWTLENFYTYQLDFKTYKDDLEFVGIEGYEDSLYAKLQANTDTEYEIDLPTNTSFLNYSGPSNVDSNEIQALVGSMSLQYASGADKYYTVLGSRAIRTYSDRFKFVDAEGLPFKTVMFETIGAQTVLLDVSINIHISSSGFNGSPEAGRLFIVSHSDDWTERNLEFSMDATVTAMVGLFTRNDYFESSLVAHSITTTATRRYVSLVYIGKPDMFGYSIKPKTTESFETRFSLTALTTSPFLAKPLTVFTFEWLIGQLLAKISSTATLNYALSHTSTIPVLSCNVAMSQLGAEKTTGKFNIKLSDVIKALHVIEGIGVDVTGNILKIDYLPNFYLKSTLAGNSLEGVNIVTEFDSTHVFNKVKIGSKATNLVEKGRWAFCCENTYGINNSLADKTLDLVSPFVMDMYTIEQMIKDAVDSYVAPTDPPITKEVDTTETKSTDDKFAIFSAVRGIFTPESVTMVDTPLTFINTDGTESAFIYGYNASPKAGAVNLHMTASTNVKYLDGDSFLNFVAPESGLYRIVFAVDSIFSNKIEPLFLSYPAEYTEDTSAYPDNYDNEYWVAGTGSYIREVARTFHLNKGDTFPITFAYNPFIGYILFNDFTFSVSSDALDVFDFENIDSTPSTEIYTFKGDKATAYNVRFSPRHLLEKHKTYIGVSNFKNSENVKHLSSSIIQEFSSHIYEDGLIEGDPVVLNEKADLATVDADVLFQPQTISFETTVDFSNLADIKSNKYKYYQTAEKGITYKGWVNTAAFSIGKNQKQQWKLQAYTIE